MCLQSLGRDCNWNENSSSASDRNVDEAPPRDAEGGEGIAKTNVSGETKPPTPKDENLNGSDQVAPSESMCKLYADYMYFTILYKAFSFLVRNGTLHSSFWVLLAFKKVRERNFSS